MGYFLLLPFITAKFLLFGVGVKVVIILLLTAAVIWIW